MSQAKKSARANIVAKVAVAAPVEEVFKYISQPKYHFLWNPHLRTIKPLDPLQLATNYQTTSLLLGVNVESTIVVTKFKSPTVLELTSSTGLLQYTVCYELTTTGQQTVVSCHTSVSSDKKAFAFAAPVLKILAQRELQTDLEALKLAIENQLPPNV